MKTIRSVILNFIIIFSMLNSKVQATTHARSRVIQLSPEQLQSLMKNKPHKVRYAVVQADKSNEETVMAVDTEEEEKQREKKERKKTRRSERSDWGEHIMTDLAMGIDNHDGVLVFFAIVGAVITIVWIATIPYTAYLAVTGKEKYDYINFATLSYARIISDSPRADFNRSGEISSIKYNLFFNKREEEEADADTGNFQAGLAAEVGHYQLRDEDEFNKRTNHVAGNFWLLGPSMMIAFRPEIIPPLYFKLDLEGGSSFSSDIGLIAKADFAVLFEFPKKVLMGFNISANYIDINDNKGIISGSHPDYLFGLNLGYKF